MSAFTIWRQQFLQRLNFLILQEALKDRVAKAMIEDAEEKGILMKIL